MMTINATQLTGMLSFGVAAVFCYGAWWATRNVSHRWGVITLVYILLAADTVFGRRYHISNIVRAQLKSIEIYQDRRVWQAGIALCLLGVAAVVLWSGLRSCRAPGQVIGRAIWLSLFGPVFFLLEAISLHSIDAILYHAAGPVLVIGWIWMVFALLTILSANGARRS